MISFGSDTANVGIKQVMEQIDINKDGLISFDEFTKMMTDSMGRL